MSEIILKSRRVGRIIFRKKFLEMKDDYVAVLKSAVGSLKVDKKRLKKLQESIGASMLDSE